MSEKEKDGRFSKVYSDPRFRTFRKVDKTLKIDNRFKSMFTEDKFKLKYSMDKRGKNKKHLISDDYKKFYRLSDEDETAVSSEKADDQVEEIPKLSNVEESNDEEKEEAKEEEKERPSEEKLTHKFGYHRGLNRDSDDESSSSSSSSESEESDDEDDIEVEHEWGELDRDADRIEEATSRIAICNADWDRINAQDLFVLLNSFKRATGAIHYVRIYYSKFGEERLRVEERKGPSEFIFGKAANVDEIAEGEESQSQGADGCGTSDDGDNEEEEEEDGDGTDPKAMEKLRKYQLERLKYFYAVVGFDCAKTAEVVYNELDGMEYESSSTTLDIRFVPEDMEFEDVKLKEECTSMPDSNNYKAPNFINTALQQSQVTLTWDETDHKRKSAFERAFEQEHEDDLKAYLATSSEDDDEELFDVEIDANNLKDDEKINKYKDLLKSLDKDKEDEDVEMEVTWNPSLKSNAESMIKKKELGTSAALGKNLNVGGSVIDDNYAADSEEAEELQDDQLLEDSEKEEEDEEEEKNKAKAKQSKEKYQKWKKKKKAAKKSADNGSSLEGNDLELLMVDMEKSGSDKKQHFNYKEIVDSYSKKGKSKGGATEQGETKDSSFKFNADDPRFGAIFSSHLYNIDQSDPNFKKTEAFDQILDRQKNKAAQLIKDEKSVPQRITAKAAGAKSWTSLVSKVKTAVDGTNGRQKRSSLNHSERTKVENSNSRFNPNKKFKR